jgi:drug/metabolite transporter (DMT)-like permease
MLLAVASVLFSGERLHLGGWLGLTASSLGAALIAVSSRSSSGTTKASAIGDLLVVLSMFAAIAWILISKRLMQRHSAVLVTGMVFWIGTLMLALVEVTTSGIPSLDYSTRVWLAVAAQGFFATAATTLL